MRPDFVTPAWAWPPMVLLRQPKGRRCDHWPHSCGGVHSLGAQQAAGVLPGRAMRPQGASSPAAEYGPEQLYHVQAQAWRENK